MAVILSIVFKLVKFKNRHELYTVNPQLLEIRDLLFEARKGTSILFFVALMHGK